MPQPREGNAQNDLAAVALRWMEEIWRPGGMKHFDELHSPDFSDHSPAGRAADREAYRAGILELYAAFPDFTAVTEDLLLDARAGKAAVRWSAVGTHRGPFLGYAPSGRMIRFTGIEIIRVENGKIVERWGEWDGLGLLDQLGEK